MEHAEAQSTPFQYFTPEKRGQLRKARPPEDWKEHYRKVLRFGGLFQEI
jgi:hypothetical protein